MRILTLIFSLSVLLNSLPAFAAESNAPGSARRQVRVSSCAQHLKAFSRYEDEVNGQIKWFFSLYSIPLSWDANAQYDGLVLIKKVDKPVLTVKFTSTSLSKIETQNYDLVLPFELDPRLLVFENFKPHEFFNFHETGRYTVILKSGDAVLCEQSATYSLGH